VELELAIKRGGAVARIRFQTGTDETPDGKVTGVVMRQFLGADQQLLLTGVVEGDRLHVKTEDLRIDKKIPWNDQVIGLARQDRFFQENKAKPGDRLSYLSYEPIINAVVTVRATVKDEEEVDVLGTKKRLLRVECVPDKVEASNAAVQLPTNVIWLDKDLQQVRSETEVPGLGKVTFHRTTREVALAPGTIAKVPDDILLNTQVRLNRGIDRPHEAKSVVYRITLKDDDEPATAFAQDERQAVKNVKGNTLEVHVRAVRGPQPGGDAGDPQDEFLKSCYYLNSDHPKVQEFAQQAVRDEKDPWKKAQRVERFVRDHMEFDNSAPFTTAGKVAESLKGDCRHHAMLAAAMCRAAGVPSRTAVGLIYTNDKRNGPVMAFHMWVEVLVKGQWLALDATLGQGSVGADHLKIADSSWYNTESLTPLLPVARVVGKVSMEVVRVNGDE
jgi:transglutaminase-like putative cysteine protease